MRSSIVKIAYTLVLFCTFIPLAVASSSQNSSSIQCPKTGVKDSCFDTHIRKDGRKYIGPWLNGVPLEKGTFYEKDGTTYRPKDYRERAEFVDIAQIPQTNSSPITFENEKKKCLELGFKSGTEGFGKCVLQLSK